MSVVQAPDHDLGSFSANGPWVVVPDELRWRRPLAAVRAASAAEVPRLTKPGRLPPGRRALRVGRILGTALAGWYLVERRKAPGTPSSRAGLSRRLRKAFEQLGPTYIKLGQVISSGEGIFPEELVSEFKLLRDRVPAESFEDVRRIIESELGRPMEEVFAHVNTAPIAAASIAQVHAARLLDGTEVVVKVQRPTVSTLVRRDLAAMAWIAPWMVGRIPVAALANPPALVELFAETIVEELDFRLEAENMLDVAAVLAQREERAVVVPRPHPVLVTKRMLVMERLSGFSFDDVAGMKAAGVDTEAVVRACMVTRLSQPRRLAFLRMLVAGTIGDVRMQLGALIDLGALPAGIDIEEVIVDLRLEDEPVDPTKMTPDELTAELQRVVKSLLGYGARMPKELMLFVKDLLFIDGALTTLAPDLDLFKEITDVATWFATEHGAKIAAEVGIDISTTAVDLDSVRASIGVDASTSSMTHRELQERRALIRKRFEEDAAKKKREKKRSRFGRR
jgi:ubiquinone biosynthesis protein